eukprot:GHVT01016640.1.p1 GENE.GHVT01016640.1~~GHVT01016640.1.p1  ORF type:complete len:789 (-),score=101.01 GHVT01016640.1:2422-4788(-)
MAPIVVRVATMIISTTHLDAVPVENNHQGSQATRASRSIPSSFFKTKRCDNYMQGSCNDSNCRFAHGRHELRSTDYFFKTNICKYWKDSVCYAGSACRHAHGEAELRDKCKLEAAAKALNGEAPSKPSGLRVLAASLSPCSSAPTSETPPARSCMDRNAPFVPHSDSYAADGYSQPAMLQLCSRLELDPRDGTHSGIPYALQNERPDASLSFGSINSEDWRQLDTLDWGALGRPGVSNQLTTTPAASAHSSAYFDRPMPHAPPPNYKSIIDTGRPVSHAENASCQQPSESAAQLRRRSVELANKYGGGGVDASGPNSGVTSSIPNGSIRPTMQISPCVGAQLGVAAAIDPKDSAAAYSNLVIAALTKLQGGVYENLGKHDVNGNRAQSIKYSASNLLPPAATAFGSWANCTCADMHKCDSPGGRTPLQKAMCGSTGSPSPMATFQSAPHNSFTQDGRIVTGLCTTPSLLLSGERTRPASRGSAAAAAPGAVAASCDVPTPSAVYGHNSQICFSPVDQTSRGAAPAAAAWVVDGAAQTGKSIESLRHGETAEIEIQRLRREADGLRALCQGLLKRTQDAARSPAHRTTPPPTVHRPFLPPSGLGLETLVKQLIQAETRAQLAPQKVDMAGLQWQPALERFDQISPLGGLSPHFPSCVRADGGQSLPGAAGGPTDVGIISPGPSWDAEMSLPSRTVGTAQPTSPDSTTPCCTQSILSRGLGAQPGEKDFAPFDFEVLEGELEKLMASLPQSSAVRGKDQAPSTAAPPQNTGSRGVSAVDSFAACMLRGPS